MGSELTRELFKLRYRKLPWLLPIGMIIWMVIMAFAMGRSYQKLLIMTCYNASQIIMLLLVIVGSTIFSMEFQNHTIWQAMYHSANRRRIFTAKLLTLTFYNLVLHLLAIGVTLFFNLLPLFFPPQSLSAIYQYHQPLWLNMLTTTGIDLVASTMIVSLLCLTSTMINSNSVVTILNAAVIFMGSGFSANLLNANVRLVNWVRWNPLNMTNLTTQYFNYETYHLTSHLSNAQLLMGTCLYTIVFTFLGYVIFDRKKF